MTDGKLILRSRSNSVGDLLRRTSRRFPRKLALVDGEVRWSFEELDAAVNRVANHLRARGVSHGDRVALVSHNCWQFVVLAFALARIGAILVPLNFMLKRQELAYILGHAEATGLVVEDGLFPEVAAALDIGVIAPRVRGWIPLAANTAPDGWETVDGWAFEGDPSPPDIYVADDDPLRLMYTSGTESRPKGVMLSSRSLIAQYASCIIDGGMEGADVELHSLPLYHCAQMDCFLGPDISLGATSIIARSPDPMTIFDAIGREKVTKFFAPPTVWISLLRHPSFAEGALLSLRKGYYGASPMPVEVLRELLEELPQIRLWNFYGQTEMAPLATILGPEEQVTHAGSAGRPAFNVETVIVDDDDNPLPSGSVGEIVHRSPHSALGYWNDEVTTAEAYRHGWFHSGDLGVLSPDGLLTIVDRKKDMIKTGGENVASREVEEVIYQHPDIAEAAVFGISHPKWVEAVAAAVVLKPAAQLDAEAIVAHCRNQLAGFKVPKAVFIVESLPKNPSGKVLKRELRERHQAAEVADMTL